MIDLDEVAAALWAGETVGIPTDTVYGLVARADDRDAHEKLYALKGRDRDKPIAVLVRDLEQALEYVDDPNGNVEALAALWPGPLTIVANRAADAPDHLGDGRGTLGVRCPDSDEVRSLIGRVGALAASSANATGRPVLTSAAEIRSEFGDRIRLLVDGGPREATASTVVDLSGGDWRVVRTGRVTAELVASTLADRR